MAEYEKLSSSELYKRLEELQNTLVAEETGETQRLLHELQVHQIELEMQNRELRETQQQLEETLEQYADLYDFAPVGYLTFDKQGLVLELNLTAAEMLRIERSRLVNNNFTSCLDIGEKRRFLHHLNQVLKSGGKLTAELQLHTHDGDIHDVRLESIAVRSPDGSMDRCHSAMIDITERKRAEDALRVTHADLEERVAARTAELARANSALMKEVAERKQAEEKLRQAATAFDHTDQGIMITDSACRIIVVNRAFTTITGYTEEEALGKNPLFLRSDKQDEEFHKTFWNDLKNNGQWQGELWNRRKNGEIFVAWKSIHPVTDEQGNITNYVVVFADISPVKESEARLNHLAHHDVLTDLPNRLRFSANLDQALESAKRRHRKVALLYLDLDRFKAINDSFGHKYGDLVLKEIAARLKRCIRAEDTAARVGGDEFIIIMVEVRHSEDAVKLADKIIDTVAIPIEADDRIFNTSVSIGISIYPNDATTAEELIKAADAALYQAKQLGRNNCQFFTPELTARAANYLMYEQALRNAIARDQFLLHYQPLVSSLSGLIIGVEALIRWQHPDKGLIQPDAFISIAEETGLIEPIGEWVLRTVFRDVQNWRSLGLPKLRLAVNFSGRQILTDHASEKILALLNESRLREGEIELELEITENVLQMAERSIATLTNLKSLGVTLAIDDFGTAYSSLSRLKHLPVDTLKVDRSFVRDIPQDPDDQAIVSAIIAMAHSLDMKVVGEGVETMDQLSFLRDRQCDEIQGFLLSQPVPAETITHIMQSGGQLWPEMANP